MGLTVRNINVEGYLRGVFPQVPSAPPVANFTATPTSGTVPLAVTFTDTSTGTPTSWLWDFKNDGTATSTQQNPSYTYTSTGTYAVKLTATNADGSNSITKTAFISVSDVSPQAGFTGSPTSGTIPLNVSFTNASTGTNLTYLWNFGNGQTSTSANPTTTYSTTGTYSVTLTASNTAGASTSTRSSYITASDVTPVAGFGASPTSGTTPLTVSFTSSSTGTNLNYVWDFMNDGTATTATTATTTSYTYANAGNYSVKLTASNSAGVSTQTRTNLITVTQPVPANFNLVTLQLPGTGTNNTANNTFLDSSTNNFTVTRVGNTTQGSYSPFSTGAGYWSNYFDGSGDSLTVPYNSALTFGSGDFTLEQWVYPQRASGATAVIAGIWDSTVTAPQSWISALTTGGNYIFVVDVAGVDITIFTSTATISNNVWTHIAVARSGNTWRLFINGVLDSTTTNSSTISAGTAIFGIGTYQNKAASDTTFNGYISNFRIVKGTAVYTANFTPSTTPLTAVSGTSLLTCQSNRFIDNSSNAFAITRVGDTRISTFGSFVPASIYDSATMGGSLYFDGTNDYLTIPDSTAFDLPGDFTIEFYVYPVGTRLGGFIGLGDYTSGQNGFSIYYNSNRIAFYSNGADVVVGGSTILANAWTHVAIVRSGSATNNLKLYINGVQDGQGSTNVSFTGVAASGMTIDADYGGAIGATKPNQYLSNIRLVKGSAVYTSSPFTPPSTPVTAISGTSLLLNATNAGIYDVAAEAIVETLGDAKISTTVSANGSIYLDGTGDYLTAPTSDTFAFGTGDFTVECWVRFGATSGFQLLAMLGNGIDASPAAYNAWSLYLGNGNLNFRRYAPESVEASRAWSPTTSQWYHVAVSRSGSNLRLFVDGTQLGATFTNSTNYAVVNTNPLTIGRFQAGGNITYSSNFYMNDLRITKGAARYTANFTPPTRS